MAFPGLKAKFAMSKAPASYFGGLHFQFKVPKTDRTMTIETYNHTTTNPKPHIKNGKNASLYKTPRALT